MIQPTLLGYVGAVTGAKISVLQAPSVASGIAIIGGKSYRIGQVGSFIRIPQGYHDLYGIVSEVGASATPETERVLTDHGERWMTIQLVGEMTGTSFERGISQYPSVNDEVHLVTEEDLSLIYGGADGGQVVIGRLANAEGIPVRVDLDKLVTRHSAVLGSTGAGKSTTVASLLRSVVVGEGDSPGSGFSNARILLLDIHGEYGQALSSISTIFRVNHSEGEAALNIPYWALEPVDLLNFLMGKMDEKASSQILEKIMDRKAALATTKNLPGVDLNSLTADSPIPYSLKSLWYQLIEPEIKTWSDAAKTIPALAENGDAESLKAPRYLPNGLGNTPPFLNTIGVLSIRRQLDQMRSRILDRRFDFLLHPGPWEPNLNGETDKDLADLLQAWLGHDKPITILDLSGIPSTVLVQLIAAILKIIYEGLFWGREKSEGGIQHPLMVVMEEAHRYLSKDGGGPARDIVQRIVKEGRKFGIGAMIVSQRPAEVDETILSQCGTFVALRLSNAADRNKVQGSLPDSLAGLVESLPILRTGEAIITGEAARLPLRCRISLPNEEFRPKSEDPKVAQQWKLPKSGQEFSRVAAAWRAQNTLWVAKRVNRTPAPQPKEKTMERQSVTSSNIVSVGYDSPSETLEIEFRNGIYQYYNVPEVIYDQLMASPSLGQYFAANIKNAFSYSRV